MRRSLVVSAGSLALCLGAACNGALGPAATGAAGAGGQGASSVGGGAHGGVGGGGGHGAQGGVGSQGGLGGVGAQGGMGAQGGVGGQGGGDCTGPVGTGAGPCEFPQGVPDDQFVAASCSYSDTDPSVDAAVNSVMAALTGCGVGSDCPLTGFAGANADEVCQSWFEAVTEALRAQGLCAGQHVVGVTDEIAVSNTGCDGKWYGYHVCNYGGPKVVWNPGARRGWWAIEPAYCP